jgi:capsular exopolysaccharide synthesis family protein
MPQNNITLYNNSALTTAEPDPGYGQLLAVLGRRKMWFIGVFFATLTTAATVTLVMRPTYRSSMQMMVESNYKERRSPNDTRPSFADPNFETDAATQVNLMRSPELLERAIAQLKTRYPDLTVRKLTKRLAIAQVQEQRGNDKVPTSLVSLEYIEHDRVKTREVLKALQKVYQEYNLEQQRLRLSKGLSFINDQIPQVESKVNQAEAELKRFRQAQDLVNPEQQSKALVESLAELRKEQQRNRSNLAASRAQYFALQQQLAQSPKQAAIAARLSQSKRYQNMLSEIQKTEIALVQQQLRFTNQSPAVQQLAEQRARQQGLLWREAQQVLGADAGAVAPSADALVQIGQMGENDLKFASDLTQAQVDFYSAQSREQALAQSEEQLRGELKRFPALLSEFNRLQPNVNLSRETLQELQKARQELSLEIARGGFDWQVVENPRLGRQIGPSWLKNLLVGAAAGLMLGAASAFWRESKDDSIRTSEDLTKQTSIPLLGMVPELPMSELMPIQNAEVQAAMTEPDMLQVLHWAPFRESLDLIYKNLQLLTDGSPMRSLVVTSALAGEGKSTIALGLAISAARLHQRVLLVDADLRRPGLHRQLQLPNEQGLSTLLSSEDRSLAQTAIQPASTYSDLPISVITAGPTPSDSVKLLSSKRMKDLMSTFEEHYDLIIVDSPPVLGMVDSLLAASFCDGTLLVGRMGQVNKNEVSQAVQSLDRLNLVGVIANGANTATQYYYRAANYS